MGCGREDRCPCIPVAGCCPYGPLAIFPFFFVLISVCFSLVVMFDCYFISSISDTESGEVSYGVGPWTVQNFRLPENGTVDGNGQISISKNQTVQMEECEWWGGHNYFDWDDSDAPLMVARYCSMIAVLISIFLLVVSLLWVCVKYPRGCMPCLSCCSFTAAVVVGLTLIMVQTKFCAEVSSCALEESGWVALYATGSWLISGVLIIFLPAARYWGPPPPKELADGPDEVVEKPDEGETVKMVEYYVDEKSGATMRKTTTTTTYLNGNQTITEVLVAKDPYEDVRRTSVASISVSLAEELEEVKNSDSVTADGSDTRVVTFAMESVKEDDDSFFIPHTNAGGQGSINDDNARIRLEP